MLTCRRSSEDGVAIIAALILLVLAGLLTIAIFVASQTSADGAKTKRAASTTELLARDAGTALVSSFNAMRAGEQNGYVLTKAMLDDHAAKIGDGATVLDNSSKEIKDMGMTSVDKRVPSSGEFTLRRRLESGMFGYWQVYSVKLPQYGVTRGGRVLVYVRAWAASGDIAERPKMYRLEFRPTWFADYQLMFDGKGFFNNDAKIAGRVHSNGFPSSYYDQYGGQAQQIRIEGGAQCSDSAVISTAKGTISGCGTKYENTGRNYDLLRARTAIAAMRGMCASGNHPTINMSCPNTLDTNVHLDDKFVYINGNRISAEVEGDVPGDNQGAVVIAPGNIELSGSLGANARALVIAASPPNSADYGQYGAPSIYIRSSVGSGNSPTSSFGAIAEGDIVLPESSITPGQHATVRGAFLTISGLMSHDQRFRLRVPVNGGQMGGAVTIEGSIVGHYAPLMESEHNGAGFKTREYTWNGSLFDNPPPMYPTAADWELIGLNVANLDCFNNAGELKSTESECG